MRVRVEHTVRAGAVMPTQRALETAAMFGLDGCARDITLIPPTQLDLPLPGPGITFITGPSGSGKSTLLRLLCEACAAEGAAVLRLDAEDDEECWRGERRAIVDLVAADGSLGEALHVLSRAGLGDAFALLRRPSELSDGQRFRFRVAQLLAQARARCSSQQQQRAGALTSGNTLVVMDEFAATLDRETARTLARNIRRWSDQTGVSFLLATTHDDLLAALQPDVVIRKGLGEAITVEQRAATGSDARIERHGDHELDEGLVIEPGTMDDYRALARFHYRSHHPGAATSVLRVRRRAAAGAGTDADGTIGVLVRSLPALRCTLRDRATGGRYLALTERERGVVLGREVRCISRVVIDPRYRGLGLAVRLVRHALEHREREGLLFTEALAAMGRVSPFFERAGMQRYDLPAEARPAHARLLDALHALGLRETDLALLSGAASCGPRELLDAGDAGDGGRALLARECRRFLRATARRSSAQLDAMSFKELVGAAHRRLGLRPVYYLFSHAE